MDSFSEVRRVRKAMSDAVGHDVRKLAALINARRGEVADRIIDPGTKAEQCDPPKPPIGPLFDGQSTPAAG